MPVTAGIVAASGRGRGKKELCQAAANSQLRISISLSPAVMVDYPSELVPEVPKKSCHSPLQHDHAVHLLRICKECVCF